MKQDCLPIEGVNYSTSEKVVGTWIDGKPLYQRTISVNKATSTTGFGLTQISIPVKRIVKLTYTTTLTDTSVFEGLVYVVNGQQVSYIRANITSPYMNLFHYCTIADWVPSSIADIFVTVQYTKTTD